MSRRGGVLNLHDGTKSLLQRHNLRPSRGLGQSFLVDEGIAERIVAASDLGALDVVLEVGPGLGLLTRRLAARAGAVVAVELDRRMLPILSETLAGHSNVTVIQGDILELDAAATIAHALGLEAGHVNYQVVANLPYYITSAVLRHLLSNPSRPSAMTIMVQREVADRIMAGPGALSLLAISVQVYGRVQMVCPVPSRAFLPAPKVSSAVLRIEMHGQPRVAAGEIDRFFRVVRAGFAQKRKQLHNSLSAGLPHGREVVVAALARAEIAPDRRPQTLDIDEWRRLAANLPD